MSSEQFKADESGLLVVFMDPGASVTLSEFHEWYDTEHVPLRIERFPTFRSAVRYSVTSHTSTSSGGEKVPETGWGAFYTVSSNSTFSDTSYTSLRSQRSEREAELFTRLAVVDRRIYRLEYDSDNDTSIAVERKRLGLGVQTAQDTPRYLVANSVDFQPGMQDEYNAWFEQEHVPLLAKIPGWRRSRRFTLLDNGITGTAAQGGEADSVPRTLGLHEYDNDAPESTPEFKAALDTPWRAKLVGEGNCNVVRRERKTCTVYRAWDPIAAIEAEQKSGK